MRPLSIIGLALCAIAAAGCASGSTVPTTAASPRPGAESPAAIVGEWVGVHDCAKIVEMMHDAALDEFALEQVSGNGLVPGVTTEAGIKDPANPCDGAVERQHSHFFTADGAFGSKDFNGQQVDDGQYTVEGDDVLVINGLRFRYTIDGDTMTLDPEPVDISGCTDKECRFPAAWVLMVALPGSSWTRGEVPST